MRNIKADMSVFLRALKLTARKRHVVLNKNLSCLVGVNYFFYTKKAVWSFTPDNVLIENVFEAIIIDIDNVELCTVREVR